MEKIKADADEIRIAIVGGGPAGLMAAAILLDEHASAEIHLFEKYSQIGGKIPVTGGGRCNLTTALTARKKILASYTRGAEFLKPALDAFPPKKVVEWFASRGLKTKVENEDKIFPVSDRADDVVELFGRIFSKRQNVKIFLDADIDDAACDKNGKFILSNRETAYDFLLIATGGKLNTEFAGYRIARKFGHSVTALAPSLTSLETAEKWRDTMAGLSLSGCKINCVLQNGAKISAEGDLLFTHSGLSGPAVFTLSSRAAYEKIGRQNPLKIFLIADAKRNFQQWEELLMERAAAEGARKIKNLFYGILPERFTEIVLQTAGVDKEKNAAVISKEQRRRISKILGDGLEINVIARGKGDEMSIAGGVDTDEVDPETCESKIIPNLYFAGEILNIDGVTGGFNLQNCWMTGKLAGLGIAKKIKERR